MPNLSHPARFVLVVLLCASCCLASELQPTLVDTLKVPNAAVLAFAPQFPPSGNPALLATTFAVGSKEPVYYIDLKSTPHIIGEPKIIEDVTKWNNYVGMVPKGAVPGSTGGNVVMTAGGFLVPGQTTGEIDLWEVSNPASAIRTKVSVDKKNYFYHHAEWYDINQDGRMDIIAARATAPTTGGAKKGELIWLEQPANFTAGAAGPWAEHALCSGPDVGFIFEDITGDGKPELIATEFFSAPQLAMYSCPKDKWSDCDQNSIQVTVLDRTSGPFFNLQYVDMNNDGKKDLLVTNNQDKPKTGPPTGSVFVYEQPSDPFKMQWPRHTIATGYEPFPKLISGPGRGSPGTAIAFHERTTGGGKPSVLLSGDDGGFVAILKPAAATTDGTDSGTDSGTEWQYTQTFLCNSTGTIGSPDIGDYDGDGITDVFIPFYSEGKIEIYTFKPGPAPPAPSSQCITCLGKKDPVHLSHDSAWCYKDNQCHLVGSPANPCTSDQCSSQAKTSKCGCTTCNDPACSSA